MESIPLDVADAAEFSFFALFMRADIIVKATMAILVLASIWSWAVVVDKQLMFGGLKAKSRRFRSAWARIDSMRAIENIGMDFRDSPYGQIVNSALGEVEKMRDMPTRDSGATISFSQRIERVMGIVLTREISKAENGLGVLASVGSASPFIGLFGTVWGIMNSFRAIAVTRDTNLAVVAPGIAEALFATALGLIAAVPAVIFYNKYSTDLSKFATDLETYADDLAAILSRRGPSDGAR